MSTGCPCMFESYDKVNDECHRWWRCQISVNLDFSEWFVILCEFTTTQPFKTRSRALQMLIIGCMSNCHEHVGNCGKASAFLKPIPKYWAGLCPYVFMLSENVGITFEMKYSHHIKPADLETLALSCLVTSKWGSTHHHLRPYLPKAWLMITIMTNGLSASGMRIRTSNNWWSTAHTRRKKRRVW